MIKLNEFVSETLREIVVGIREAQAASGSLGGRIVPELQGQGSYESWDPQSKAPVQMVSFDVAVSTSQNSATEGQVGVFVGPIKLGSSGQSEAVSSAQSRIKFDVPVALPNDTGVDAYVANRGKHK